MSYKDPPVYHITSSRALTNSPMFDPRTSNCCANHASISIKDSHLLLHKAVLVLVMANWYSTSPVATLTTPFIRIRRDILPLQIRQA